MGFAPSRGAAKQLVGYGHFTVNGRKVTIPSYRARVGDKVAIRAESKDHPSFKEVVDKLKSVETPTWLNLDKNELTAIILGKPTDVPQPFDMNIVVDFYS